MSGKQQNSTDKAVARLEAGWPLWEFWLVPVYIGRMWWCARLRDDHKRVLNAHSAAELTEYLQDEPNGREICHRAFPACPHRVNPSRSEDR